MSEDVSYHTWLVCLIALLLLHSVKVSSVQICITVITLNVGISSVITLYSNSSNKCPGALNFMNPKSGILKIKVRQKVWWSGVFAFFSRGVIKEGALFECMGDRGSAPDKDLRL